MSRKKLESWHFWIAVDIVAIYIYAVKGLHLTAGLYTAFLIMAIVGLQKWKQSMQQSPETTTIPLTVRAGWIRALYPQVQIVEAWDGPTDAGYTPEIMKIQDTYILAKFHDKGITHFYSSEPYGDHVSKALKAVNRTVDLKRLAIPVSGTQVRSDPFSARMFVHDIVYRDHVINVVFLGGPSTGKTTLAEYLAQKFSTVWMPEYGREYWDNNQVNRRLTTGQLVEIARGHIEREDQMLLKANRYLFTDTNALTTRIFSYHYHGTAEPELEDMATHCVSRYDLCFVCGTDIPYEDSIDRSGEINREIMQKQVLADLHCRRIPYLTVTGSVAERASQVCAALASLQKFTNPWRL
ncbi:MAG TPA: AAA family ATPase [Candidatus Rifleibacterium sp.]|nr:AAA family ATPase [Candidatus Rifleibacterium sp.]